MKNTPFIICIALLGGPFVLAQDAAFGARDPGLLNLKGTIYYLHEDTAGMPADLGKQTPRGVIYADKLDISAREFTAGFPGVTDRFEWFGLLYTGKFEITRPGVYKWRLESDDGSRLWLDDQEVIDNDGVHGMASVEGERELGKGLHSIKVWYFQGPATEVGLQLFVTRPGEENERIFSLADYSASASGAFKNVNARATKDGIRVQLDAQILFDTNKFELKPGADPVIKNLVQIIATYPGCRIRVEGHTDSEGPEDSNQKLSENRANAVKAALLKAGVSQSVVFETVGHGERNPIADNGTEKGRAQNRRVEVLIKP